MGLLGDFAIGMLNAAVDSVGVQTDVYIMKGDRVGVDKLLDKIDSLIQREDFIVDPKITTRIEKGVDDSYTISIYETETSKLELCAQDYLYDIQLGMAYDYKFLKKPFKNYIFAYYPDKNNTENELFLLFTAGPVDGPTAVGGNLYLMFKSNAGTIDPQLELRIVGVSDPAPSVYTDFNIGFHKMLKKMGREDFFYRLEAFIKNPYTLTEAERERREAEERKRQEEERLMQERKDAEERRRIEEEERKRREEEEQKKQRMSNIMSSLDDL